MSKKKKIGRISFIVILINLVLLLIYFANSGVKQAENENAATESISELTVLKDESVNDNAIRAFENIVTLSDYDEDNLAKIHSYNWYFTDNISYTDNFIINGNDITVYVGDDDYAVRLYDVLSEAINNGGVE